MSETEDQGSRVIRGARQKNTGKIIIPVGGLPSDADSGTVIAISEKVHGVSDSWFKRGRDEFPDMEPVDVVVRLNPLRVVEVRSVAVA